MPNNLASNSTAPDFSEASPGYGGAAALPSVDLYNQTQEFAARRRIKMGKGTWQDYARFASELPGQLVNNLASAAVSGATAPADALAGRLPMEDPNTGHTSEEGMRRGLDLAGLSSSATLGKAPTEGVELGAGAMKQGVDRAPYVTDAVLVRGDKHYTAPTHLEALELEAKERGAGLDDLSPPEEDNFKFKLSDGRVVDRLTALQAADRAHQLSRDFSLYHEDNPEKAPGLHSTDVDESIDNQQKGKGPELYANKSKEAGALALASDTERASPFYSAVERAVGSNPTKAASGDQWLATLKNAPGVKGEELETLGLEKTLAGKPKVSKEELQQAIAANKVKLGEVWKGGDKSPEEMIQERAEQLAETHGGDPEEYYEQADNELRGPAGEGGGALPKFSEYQLPGGDNYKEMLVTLPMASKDLAHRAMDTFGKPLDQLSHDERMELAQTTDEGRNQVHTSPHWDEPNVLAHVRMNDRYLDAPSVDHTEAIGFKIASSLGIKPDAIASGAPEAALKKGAITEQEAIDYSKREGFKNQFNPQGLDTNAGKKTLFLEELQSDWHQTGRKEGYRTDQGVDLESRRKAEGILTRAQQAGAFIVPSRLLDQGISPTLADHMLKSGRITQEEANFLKDYKPRHTEEFARDGMVPDAPFKRSWPQLLLHRMVRHAAENGYDQIAWTDGATQAERYDLSKHVKQLEWDRTTHHLRAMGHNGSLVIDKEVTPEQMPDTIGKEASEKLLNNPTHTANKINYLSGLDLKVGGEGMKGFYDDMLPKIANKAFGKLGGKVKTQKLVGDKSKTELQQLQEQYDAAQTNDERWRINDEMRQLELLDANNDGLYKGEGKDHTIHVLPITPEMRRHALSKGFPLFSSGVPVPDGSSVEPYQRDKVVSGVKLTPVDHQPEF